jgi:hypothetical protein
MRWSGEDSLFDALWATCRGHHGTHYIVFEDWLLLDAPHAVALAALLVGLALPWSLHRGGVDRLLGRAVVTARDAGASYRAAPHGELSIPGHPDLGRELARRFATRLALVSVSALVVSACWLFATSPQGSFGIGFSGYSIPSEGASAPFFLAVALLLAAHAPTRRAVRGRAELAERSLTGTGIRADTTSDDALRPEALAPDPPAISHSSTRTAEKTPR